MATSFKDLLFGSAVRGGLYPLAVQIFIGAGVLMIAALILMSFTLTGLKNSRVQFEATEDTLLEIATVESRLLDSDRALNGFVIGQDPYYSSRLPRIRGELKDTVAKLARSVRGDPATTAMVQSIADRVSAREKLFDYLLAHPDEVARYGTSPTALAERRLTSALRGSLWEVVKRERDKRYAQHTGMIGEAVNSIWIAVGIVVLALLSGAASLYLAGIGITGRRA